MTTRFRRERAAVPSVRAFVRSALRGYGVPCGLAESLIQAAAEACNNAILHGGGDNFAVTVVVEGTDCTIVVSDTGAGFVPPVRAEMPAPDAPGNRGLALMQALVDRVDVTSSQAGTTVVLAHSLAADRVAGARTNGLHATH